MQPSIKSMHIHYQAKHPNENWEEEALDFYTAKKE